MSNICAISTPHGIGGIAVIRISGPDAVTIVDAHFRPFKAGHTLATRPSHTLTFGQFFKTPVKDESADPLDEVVCSLYRAPHSFTDEDVVEISCHGSLYIQQQILESLCTPHSAATTLSLPREGRSEVARLAKGGEFTQRAFQNGRLDLSQAEAVADLIASQSAASHRVAMSQMKGSISRKLDDMRDQLLQLTSLLELELDFSEEEVEFADRQRLIALTEAIALECERLSSTFQAGNAIKNGIPVAIIGAPNVGKSTLLNALLKDDRAIVSDIQGTTRDIIEDTITLGGQLFRFLDTAGIRETTDTIEALGIERSLKAAERAQIIILLTEPDVPFAPIQSRPDQTIIRIVNKTPEFQALNNIGVAELEQQLIGIATSATSSSGDVIITNQRHKQALDEAAIALRRALEGLRTSLPSDLVAEDLRQANQTLGEILSGGTITSQETLNNIFSHFCIGK